MEDEPVTSSWSSVLPGMAGLAGFAVAGVGLVVAFVAVQLGIGTDDTGAPPWWFLPLCGLAWAWNAYWYLFRVATRVEVRGELVRWWCPLRSGSAPVRDVRHVGPWVLRPMVRLAVAGRPPVLVLDRRGFARSGILDSLRDANPDITFDAW